MNSNGSTPAHGDADADLAEIRAKEATLATLEAAESRLRDDARAIVGVTGREDAPSLRDAIGRSGVGWYPATALGLLAIVDEFQTNALLALGPEITSALGLPRAGLAIAILLKTLVLSLAVLPIVAVTQGRALRAKISVITGFVWSLLTVATGFVVSIWGLLALMLTNGASAASVRAFHEPLLLDSYPPESRVRVLSFYRGADAVGRIVGPLLIAVCTAVLGLTWRGVFVGLGMACLLASVCATRLRDPGYGRWDTERVRALVRDGAADDVTEPAPAAAGDPGLGFFEVARQILMIPTMQRILTANAVLGMLLAPLLTYLAFFLQESWGMGPAPRATFMATMSAFSVAALALLARPAEVLFRRDPARLLRLAGLSLGAGVSFLAFAMVVPVFAVMVLSFGTAYALFGMVLPVMTAAMMSIVPAATRAHAAALQGLALFGMGGMAGVLLLSGVDRRFGAAGAILSLAPPGIGAGLVLRSAARTIHQDLDRMLDEVIEDEEIQALTRAGRSLPMLACRHIDFSYGQVQVLFDVNFTVDDGEMVALLGTNGAGKSTLLRVISGLGLPTRGSVRLRGADITFLDAERRTRRGIIQVPGGKAVFGPLSIVENIRLFAYTFGADRRAVDRGIDASFEAFPRLGERRNQLASTLSGGEQQMLGLAFAFVVQPRLLLIDELSLGLSPKIVGELLHAVRQLNGQGTAVVLIEQSVNVALDLVDHAYFMERGEIRFDGPAKDLVERGDLLRSVFLEGASKGLAREVARKGRSHD